MNKTDQKTVELPEVQAELNPETSSLQDLADRLQHLPGAEKKKFILSRPPAEAASILWRTNRVTRSDIVHHLDNRDLAAILSAGPVDWASDELRLLPPAGRERVLARMEPAPAGRIRKLLSYPPETAGARMSPEVVPFNQDLTVAQAGEIIRRSPTPVFHCYVVDQEGKLQGVVPMRKLLTADLATPLKELMTTAIISVPVTMDQEEVARLAARRIMYALPVVDGKGVLVGSITLDKVMRVLQEEASEDIYKMAGTAREETTARSVFTIAWIRAPWLLACWAGGLVAALIIGVFEEEIAKVAALAAFLPVILDMGGNIGSQSGTVVVRGLALGEVDFRELGKTVWKEVRVGLLLGLAYGLFLGIFALFRFPGFGFFLSITVGIAIFASMLIAATMGAVIPFIFTKINLDPAVATGPLVTTIIDILGIVVYFGIAKIILSRFLYP